jgi:molecular chaperone GrpE
VPLEPIPTKHPKFHKGHGGVVGEWWRAIVGAALGVEEMVTEPHPEELRQEILQPEEGRVGDETALPIEDLAQKVESQAKELMELQEKYLRLVAEIDNYKKRIYRERAELLRTANEGLLLEFLPVLDNLERALKVARSSHSPATNEALIEGIDITLRLFKGVLEKAGVKEIESVGQAFDPTVHHAVEQVESADDPENTVVEEILRGYLLDQRVLRPALVKVSKAVGAPQGVAEGSEVGHRD